jgi:modulator of FtsH protease HflC
MTILRNPILWAGLAFAFIVVAMSTLYTVHETQQGVILRLGKPARIVNAFDAKAPFGTSGAGLSVKAPFIENVIFVDKRVLNLDMEQQTVLTTDQLRLVVDAFARFRVVDPLRMVQTVGTEQNLNDALKRILASKMRNELGKQPFASLLSPERTAMMDDIQSTVNRQAKQYGAEIIDVRIKRADLPSGIGIPQDAIGPAAGSDDDPRARPEAGAAGAGRCRCPGRQHLCRQFWQGPAILCLLPRDAGVSDDVQRQELDGGDVPQQ